VFNLNDGKLTMVSTEFELGGVAEIELTSSGNKIIYDRKNRKAGLAVGTSINDQYPYVAVCATNLDETLNANDSSGISGFIANTNKRETEDSIQNSVIGKRFHIRDKAVSFEKGFLFKTDNDAYFSPMNTGSYDYDLGRPNNKWKNIYGTMASTSVHNAKMNIENVDGQQAFDYFNLMKVKTYFYKNDDYTNPYNKKVSPIIEQLEPSLENMYKATDEALDINSNFFLFVKAMQHYIDETNLRLEVLENGRTV